ncbi:gamma-glutamyltransferase family protein [Rhodococcus marinonascens]|uniref:gamma-glutamyltransferase family protein n=1 Tax=Rhodococcus marinonascens TaxID=38311 RepID=UPI0009341F1F|nr:gamma-glutamyltransferase [Rhodococcus marinonascens]
MNQRPVTLSVDGMVSSSHPATSTVGARVLTDGGNAIDATLAMASMGWLTLPGRCGIGADAFAVVREPDGSVWTVSGSGFGPDGGDMGFFADRGIRSIPLDGALAVTVPGAPAALGALHAGGASRPLIDLWAPAIRVAERGLPCSASTRADIREAERAISADAELGAAYLPGGRLPQVGQLLPLRELAESIRALARDPLSFYSGSFAERAVDALCAGGAPFSGDEWAAGAQVQPEAAISGHYAGAVIHQTPLPAPGWMVLQQAALCDGVVGASPWLTAPAIDRMACAARLAFEDRFATCGTSNDAWKKVLEPAAIKAARNTLDGRVASTGTFGVSDGDTTSTVAVDSEGRAVSFIHSLAFTFGSKMTVPGTGVVLNNRFGRGAYLIPGHPNSVAPRRKPLNTLNAWVITDMSGNLLHVGNTPGGDGQAQWNMQLISHLLDHGLDPAEAVAAPRFTVFPGSDANVVGSPAELRCESRIPERVRGELRTLGHDIAVQGAWEAGGSAQIISVDNARGVLSGAADPRQEGIALGV